MASPGDFPSLMDDADFLSELERMEGPPPSRAADRASRDAAAAIQPQPPAAAGRPMIRRVDEPLPRVLRRDVDRFQVYPDGAAAAGDDPDSSGRSATLLPAFLMILIGLSAGAVSSALVFHERVRWLVALWSR
jgi:hypothetical protein